MTDNNLVYGKIQIRFRNSAGKWQQADAILDKFSTQNTIPHALAIDAGLAEAGDTGGSSPLSMQGRIKGKWLDLSDGHRDGSVNVIWLEGNEGTTVLGESVLKWTKQAKIVAKT